MKKSMLSCDKGADFLTMRIVVVLMIAAALIAMAAVYVDGYTAGFSMDRARQEAARIAEASRSEYVESCPDAGEGSAIDVTVPGSVRRIVFGGSINDTGVERDARAYFIEYPDGSAGTYVSDARFAYGNDTDHTASDAPVALYPGDYSLRIRLLTVNGSVDAVIYGGSPC
jgi:hypothetical protein